MTARLAPATAPQLPPTVERPRYDRAAQKVGIVHLGLGAFARAHIATYTEGAMAAGDRDWAIAGVSLRSAGVRDALAPQDGLYCVVECGGGGERIALIGAIRRIVVEPERPGATAALIAAPASRIVTLTVTEKAYAGGIDDGREPDAGGGTIYRALADGLAQRRAAGLPGLTLISCDNLSDNGGVLRRGLAAWLERRDPTLRAWFEAECACPATMVDRIVPAVTAADRDRVEAAIGLRDEGAVVTEPFRQWVIEDRFAGPRPRWAETGAQFVRDVAPFEAAKLRLLNGAHSALAYLGLHAGHCFVHEAIADPGIAATVERLMRHEAAASLESVAGQDWDVYADALLARFRNAALPHRLAQIATDGSNKVPQRWLEPLAINARRGRSCPATLRALAAWLAHVRGDKAPVADPIAAALAAAWRQAGREGIVAAVFGPRGLVRSDWIPTEHDRATILAELATLGA